ncbi:hypothetical protein [Fibrobacter sp. UWT3]|uniref:hypothetical protein n=1 Tax=Fibrobacter sp. UWT3 TaxID=1896225 RepID=UPI0011426AAF|nr:hypothetical protein [Fibrobacter sp. UWT3]
MKKEIFFILLFCLFAHAEQSDLYSFYYKGERIEVCQKGCQVKYEKRYDGVVLRHEGTSVYLIGDDHAVARFLYDSGFRLEKMFENNEFVDGSMVKTKNYTYKLNRLTATNSDYNIYLRHGFFFGDISPDFMEELKKDDKKIIFTIAPRKAIRTVK